MFKALTTLTTNDLFRCYGNILFNHDIHVWFSQTALHNFMPPLSRMQLSRCLSLSQVVELKNQKALKKGREIQKRMDRRRNQPKLPVIEIAPHSSIADLAKACSASLNRVFEAFEVVNPDLVLSKHTKIKDLKLVVAALRVLGLRCRVLKKEKETIVKEDLDAYRSPPTTDQSRLSPRPPIVTIMGHIDHGKTTLLDALHHTNVVEGEAGGITQAIGAFSVDVSCGKKMTFLDTPGHAAFATMRKRGALATDMVVLVVAADDGVMEQTVESINAIKLANVPVIVAVNKCDLKRANLKKVYDGLAEHGIIVDEMGGNVQTVKISALKKKGLDHLVDAILLQADMLELAADNKANVEGVVIESRMSPIGALASVIVQQGTLCKGQWLVAGTHMAKVKRIDDCNVPLKEVLPGCPVNILGWKSVPHAGDEVLQVNNEARAKQVVQWRTKLKEEEKAMLDDEIITQKRDQIRKEYKRITQSDQHKLRRLYKIQELVQKSYQKPEDALEYHVFVKADVDGSLDALLNVLDSYDCNDQCELKITDFSVGSVKRSDIERAALCNGVICCFNVEPSEEIAKFAEEQNVEIISSDIIYHLISKLKKDISSLLPQVEELRVIGEATVKSVFEFHKKNQKFTIAGCTVTSGNIFKKNTCRIVRNNEVIAEAPLISLRSYNDDVKTISAGKDCGIIIDTNEVPLEGDKIQCCEPEMVNDSVQWNPPGF